MKEEISYNEMSRNLGQRFAEMHKDDIYISEFFDLPRFLDASIMKTSLENYKPRVIGNDIPERVGSFFTVRVKSRRKSCKYPVGIIMGKAEHIEGKFVPVKVEHTCEDSLYRSHIFACSHIIAALMEADKYQSSDHVSTVKLNKNILSEWKKIKKIPDNKGRLIRAYRALETHHEDCELKPFSIMNARLDYLMRRNY